MLIEASFRPTFWLIYRFGLSELRSRFRFLAVIPALMLVASLALYVLLALTPPSREHPEKDEKARSLLVNGVPIPAVFVALYFLIPLWSARSVMQNPNFAGEFLYAFSDEGVTIKTPLSNSDMRWAAFVKARETSWAFLLYPQNAVAHVVAKTGFSSDADAAAVRELIRQHLAKSKLQRGRQSQLM